MKWLTLTSLAILIAGCSSLPWSAGAASSSAEQAARGAELYAALCQSCHGGPTGGSMMDMPPRHNANGHTWHHPDCQLVEIVLDGSGEMGQMMRRMMGQSDTPPMPAFRDQLTREDVGAILASIKTWWTEEQRQTQARITRERCP